MLDEELKRRRDTIMALMNDPMYQPMKIKELAIFLDVPKSNRESLKEVLDSLLAEGKISLSVKGKYSKPKTKHLIGVYTANKKGFGFVTVEGLDQDIFIPEGKDFGALHGDTVKISVDNGRAGRRAEGHVLEIVKHANEIVIGYYKKNKNFGFVMPDNQKVTKDIFIPEGYDMGAVTGHKVIVQVTDFGENGGKKPEGKIIEIIGHVNDPGTDIMSIIKAYGLPEEFPEEVMNELKNVPDEVAEADKVGRMDLRDVLMVTIDGEDAKDLDDAVSLSREGDIWKLGVHIADVSHYVREGSPLDKEALSRGTSIYLVDRVIPMLPHKLSNGICSLNEGCDRLALSCLMDVDDEGRVVGHEIARTVICTNHRMTYTDVNAIITNHDEALSEKYADSVEMFNNMKTLADKIRKSRAHRGAIDFDFPESKVILDEKGKPIDIKPYDRNAATRLIEDFMLIANETVAEDFFWQEIPFLYRTHDNPDPEKMKSLATFINNFGFSIHNKQGEVHPKEVQKLLESIEGDEAEPLISRITLRSMKQARYTVDCSGHFGLAAKYYTHFTSPIRRYPDLQIHRIIKERIKGKLDNSRQTHYEKILPGVAEQSSNMERRAEEAERETIKYKKCEFMQQYVGQRFEGVICGVTAYGIYVELPNTVEGMIRVTDLEGDYFEFHEDTYEMVGAHSKKKYRLGEKIWIEVSGTDKLTRTIDFKPSQKPKGGVIEDDE